MSNKALYQKSYEVAETLRPIYTGGSIDLDEHGRILATTLGEDALLTDLSTGGQLAKIEGFSNFLSGFRAYFYIGLLFPTDPPFVTTNRYVVTPSASHLIVCSRSLSMRIYALSSTLESSIPNKCDLVRTLKPHTTPVIVTAVDQSSSLIATGAADGVIKVWDLKGGYVTHNFNGPNVLITALHFFDINATNKNEEKTFISIRNQGQKLKSRSDNGAQSIEHHNFYLASGSQDGKVRIWDLQRRRCSSTLDSHVSDVTTLAYSEEKKMLLTASRDKTIMWWDVSTWKVIKVVPTFEEVECAGFLESGKYTYTGGNSGNIRIWRSEDWLEITSPQPPKAESGAIISSRQAGDFIFTAQTDYTMTLYSTSPLQKHVPTEMISSLPIIRRISGTHDEIIDLGYLLPDQSLLALATNSEDVRIVSLCEGDNVSGVATYFGADVTQLQGHEDIVICLDIDWSGHWIATGSKDNTARLWRIDAVNSSFSCYKTLTGHAESIGAICLPHQPPLESSPAFKSPLEYPPSFVLTGSQDQTIKKWEIPICSDAPAPNGKAPRAKYTRKAHDKDINAIEINHNSQLFASASQDKTVKIWDCEEGEVQGVLRGHKRGVWSVKFSPPEILGLIGLTGPSTKKGLVMTGSGDRTIRIWSLSDFSCLSTFEGHSNSVLKVCWLQPSPSVERKKYVHVVSAGGDGLVKVWDVNTGEVACTLDNHEDRVWALAVHPITNMIVSGSGDSTVTFWKDTTSSTQAASTAAITKLVEQEQKLQNYIHEKSYREAIVLALQLHHPRRLLSLFREIYTAVPETDSLCGLKAVDTVLASLSDDQIFSLLLRLRDWNTNAKTSPIAQRILWTLLKSYPSSRLSSLKVKDQVDTQSAKEVWNALKVYSEKHYKSIDELVDASYLVEYTLKGMDEINLFEDAASPPEEMRLDLEGDMIMI
ncbi:Nucleolar protein component of the small subunit (SSU) processome [Blumeria graminis f. sp. tritici 96224]|uniref:Bgt-3537 n=2 Tax=Blumeria graminis f. sp. tritici TaxID=62690 RepID=A0A061HLA2_BLUGR|nr:Nucleolar protein component of the small subunit (SSU) processome [Blumeria graminis f. sp. tritici 96224]